MSTTVEPRLTTAQLTKNTQIISLYGEIDLWRLPELQEALEAAVAEPGKKVIVDLKAATFVDSSVLGALSLAWKRLHARDGELVVVCDHPRVVRVFKITGLDGMFRFERSVQEAFAPALPSEAA